MTPTFEILQEKKLVGKHVKMSMADNKTFDLWRNFMPRRNAIKNRANGDLISMQVYDALFDFKNFNMRAPFEKWASAEVTEFTDIPEGMETFMLASGLYAVFFFKGPPSKGPEIFGYIFGTWLPGSGYELDNRPHFEILGEKYKGEHPDSEETIWIPVKKIITKNPAPER